MFGRVIRTLERTPRLAYERFWIGAEPAPHAPPPRWRELDVIGSRDFSGPPAGPLLLWDEPVGGSADLSMLQSDYFYGNLAVYAPDPEPDRFDTRGEAPLADDEFWPVLDKLNGRLSQSAIASAERELSLRDVDFILRCQESVAQRAVALIRRFEGTDRGDQVRGAGALHVIGAIIGAGRDAYEYSLANPDDYVDSSVSDNSFLVLFLGHGTLRRKLKRPVNVTSSFTPEHRRILHRVADERTARHHGSCTIRLGRGRRCSAARR
ncbi:hypothetical protein [uncultured Microbacterium sp.]|uniref:hypothetical protein n=2 Tax=uncultured Microbacterium sp. TaxID=191216 RepID=UPI0025D062A3|nr:hypothetical protein [uncultured Microbacterium sp.]